MKKVITRFPPSPTGLFHVGNARTFLFNYLFTKQNDGQIVFRLEDTDKERSKEEYAKDIIENLKWLGIEPDFSTTVRQSERGGVYKKYLEKLLLDGRAYASKEKIVKGGDRNEVIRFKNPGKKIVFNDLVRGDIGFDTAELGDFVIAKSLEEPVYHLAVVVDDHEMGVTHVIRGDDGISNTPRQILIQEAIGAERPVYAHLPMILSKDKTKLSKRKHGESVSVSYYRKAEYLPEAMVNFLALIGWNPGGEREIFGMEELIRLFDLRKVQRSGAVFNVEKLDWLNKEYLKRKPQNEVREQIIGKLSEFMPKDMADRLAKTVFERINKYSDIDEMAEEGEFDYYAKAPVYDPKKLVWQKGKSGAAEVISFFADIIALFEEKGINFSAPENIKEPLLRYAERRGRGDVLWPVRYALSGREKSPDPFTLAFVVGKEETIKRLRAAKNLLQNGESGRNPQH